jgi:hypothetical protein
MRRLAALLLFVTQSDGQETVCDVDPPNLVDVVPDPLPTVYTGGFDGIPVSPDYELERTDFSYTLVGELRSFERDGEIVFEQSSLKSVGGCWLWVFEEIG